MTTLVNITMGILLIPCIFVLLMMFGLTVLAPVTVIVMVVCWAVLPTLASIVVFAYALAH